jgi:hypothetical protein
MAWGGVPPGKFLGRTSLTLLESVSTGASDTLAVASGPLLGLRFWSQVLIFQVVANRCRRVTLRLRMNILFATDTGLPKPPQTELSAAITICYRMLYPYPDLFGYSQSGACQSD